MSYRLIPKPKAPFTTLAGKTSGPCVQVGHAVRPGPLYMHVDTELRKAVRDAGWPNPEQHAEIVGRLEAAEARVEQLEAELAAAVSRADTLQAAFQIVKPDKAKG